MNKYKGWQLQEFRYETPTGKGWKGKTFFFGKFESTTFNEVPQEYLNEIYKQERIDEGCYLTEVDFDRLDGQ